MPGNATSPGPGPASTVGLPAPARALLLQVIPILVFLVVDTLAESPLLAIGAALGFVLFQTALNLYRRRPFDRFLILDLALIGGMGAASLYTRNELFFKLKPAILEGVMVPFLGFLAFAPERFLAAYLARYTLAPGSGPAAALPLLRRLLGLMAILIVLHAGLTVLAALRLSKGAWAAISGPGFYAILLPVFGYALLLRLRARRAQRIAASAPAEAPPAPAVRRRRRR